MKLIFSFLIFLGTAQLSWAGNSLSADGIAALLTDATLYGQDNGHASEQVFQKSGVTFYSVGDAQSQGQWKIEDNKYCSAWPPNPSWACYDVANDGATVTFISSSGSRTVMSLTK